MTSNQKEMFVEALLAGGPLIEHADKMNLYAPLIGDWEIDVVDYEADGTRRTSSGEAHFAWVLEGRAIQDLWIIPPRSARKPGQPTKGNRYGTTLRVYDPTEDVWRVTWINPVTGVHEELIGGKQGNRIVQQGKRTDGSLIRWSFSDITPKSFHWQGESSKDNGSTWRLETEFFGRRVGINSPQE
jgi:hypothetical protein